jgi:glycosyltransferase involved in cell wall biosynthesis
MMLYKLLAAMDRSRFEYAVVSLRDEGALGPRIRALGIDLVPLDATSLLGALRVLPTLRRHMIEFAPDVVQTWLYHADLLAGLTAKLAGSPPVVWNVRMSAVDRRAFRPSTVAIARVCAWSSRLLARTIVCCSEAGKRAHAEFGYDATRMVVIPNGFDTQKFRPSHEARESVREQLGISASTRLVGIVARDDPHKDHATFIEAAALVAREIPDVQYLLVGSGMDSRNSSLVRRIACAGLCECTRLLGVRDDIATLTAAFDVAVSSSIGEGFSNAIGEAMACGVPCVVTDVGDSAWIVGDTGRVVPPRTPAAMANAIIDLLKTTDHGRSAIGQAARHRIESQFAIADIVRRYEALYTELSPDVRH